MPKGELGEQRKQSQSEKCTRADALRSSRPEASCGYTGCCWCLGPLRLWGQDSLAGCKSCSPGPVGEIWDKLLNLFEPQPPLSRVGGTTLPAPLGAGLVQGIGDRHQEVLVFRIGWLAGGRAGTEAQGSVSEACFQLCSNRLSSACVSVHL